MFGYVELEYRIPADRPLRGVRKLVDAVFVGVSKDFDALYWKNLEVYDFALGNPGLARSRFLENCLAAALIILDILRRPALAKNPRTPGLRLRLRTSWTGRPRPLGA